MPNKYPNKKGWTIPKQKYKVSHWREYNNALRNRANIEIWISDDIIHSWYEKDRVYDGNGTPKKFTDLAIITCHEIRQVFRLALRQCQGFMNAIFKMKALNIKSPDYSCLSKRLALLTIQSPRYRKTESADKSVVAIALDSTGLKRFGRGEWHQEKYKLSAKRSWRKLHIAVDNKHIIHGNDLTDRFTADCQSVETLSKQITCKVDHVTADGAYDKNPVYEILSNYFKGAGIIIPPDSDAVYDKNNHTRRNGNVQEIKALGRMAWQRIRQYGYRNYSELAIQRYKRILGSTLHARDFVRQKIESMIGCGVLNKMTRLGMPASYRCA